MPASPQVQAQIDAAVALLRPGTRYVSPVSNAATPTPLPSADRPALSAVTPRTNKPTPQTGLSERGKAALRYAAQGLLIVPLTWSVNGHCSCGKPDCSSPGKHPLTSNGLKDASCNAGKLREWWTKWPAANIGLVTGPASGLLVLDFDGPQGEQSRADLVSRYGPLPATTRVTTGKGFHLYFKYPIGRTLRNSQGKIAPGIDVRADGGYVVGPDSVHISGTVYTASNPTLQRATLPDAWVNLLESPPAPQASTTAAASGTTASESIGKGKRTNRLVSLTGSMHKRGMTLGAIEAALLEENRAKNSPPLPEAKVRAIAHDIPARYPNTPTEETSDTASGPDIVCLAEIAAKDVNWLWKLYLAFGMLAMLSGDPGSGKTFISLAICAGYTVGRTPDGERCEPINVLYMSVENAPAEIIRPRFDSLGGDAKRFYLLRGTSWKQEGETVKGTISLSDVAILDKALIQTRAKLIVIDPIQSYLGANVDLHRANETRPILDNLSKLAESHGCAILLIRHLSKAGGGKAITRGLGSIDLSGAVRSEMLAGALPDDPESRAIVHIKSNLGAYGPSLGYCIDADGKFSWTGRSEITAGQMLEAPSNSQDRSAVDDAREWLRDLLKEGSREQKEVRKLAENEGISFGTLRRAKDALRVKSRKGAFGGSWIWSLSEDGPKDAADEGRLTV